MVGGVPDVITCAKFQIEIFMGYDFTGRRIFDFPIDFSMGLTTVQRYCAACDYKYCLYLNLNLKNANITFVDYLSGKNLKRTYISIYLNESQMMINFLLKT